MSASKALLYRINGDDCIIKVGPGWDEFASANGAVSLNRQSIIGKPLWNFIIGDETRYLYGLILDKVRSQGLVLSFPFRCDSPILRRFMTLVITPHAAREVTLQSWTLREEDRGAVTLLEQATSRSQIFLTMCSWCKRVELENRLWVEVEEVIQSMGLFHAQELPQITHGVCQHCKTLVLKELEAYRTSGGKT